RLQVRLRILSSRNAEHAEPISTKSFRTVFLATPVIRQVEFIELPSTRHRMTIARRLASRRFMYLLCLLGQAKSRKKRSGEAAARPLLAHCPSIMGLGRNKIGGP